MSNSFNLKEGEVFPFYCISCGKTVPFTEDEAICECGHILTEDERNVTWEREEVN